MNMFKSIVKLHQIHICLRGLCVMKLLIIGGCDSSYEVELIFKTSQGLPYISRPMTMKKEKIISNCFYTKSYAF